jgi:ATP-dependent DNA helicase RecG
MSVLKKKDYLFENVTTLKGVGSKLAQHLKVKKIQKIIDLLLTLPYSYTDRSNVSNIKDLEIGKIATIKVKVLKYNFPRIRNLPNKIICEDDSNKINIVYFNSREGYLKKILPINQTVIISGKVNYFNKNYQITNPNYVSNIDDIDYVKRVIPKYSLTEGLTEKLYRKIMDQVLENLPELTEWHEIKLIKQLNFMPWKNSIQKLHKAEGSKNINSIFYRRLAYDEIFAHLLTLSHNRKRIQQVKKNPKKFSKKLSFQIEKKLNFKLTKSQTKVLGEIESDLLSSRRMFRILQGDVGSGKTIVSFLTASYVTESKYQCALMAPTEILARQHYNLALKIFENTSMKIKFISGKIEYKEKKQIIFDLKKGKIDFIIGTHSLFQKKIEFKKLGLIIVDEQHKFGVKQRMDLAIKGGVNCDVLLMSATPIPRTMMLATYGDMDFSKITEKPSNRKKIITLSKPEKKISEIIPYISKQLKNNNQIFWVCPLIEESKFLDYTSAVKKFNIMNKLYPNKVGLIHGSLEKEEKEKILKSFLNKEIMILVSTTVIEVGIDFPNANLIIIENANKFGLAQLHQLRGRVGRGQKQGVCILLFKENLNKNAIKRIKILKSSDDGFFISEEDMRLRGFGDILGLQQSGVKYFKIADPVHHEDLFKIAEKNMKILDNELFKIDKYNILLKLFDRADIINKDQFN